MAKQKLKKEKNNKKTLIWVGILVLLIILILLALNFGWFATTEQPATNTATGKVLVNVVHP
jgi:flagellar basal body-associated protein FliL